MLKSPLRHVFAGGEGRAIALWLCVSGREAIIALNIIAEYAMILDPALFIVHLAPESSVRAIGGAPARLDMMRLNTFRLFFAY
jgi:hypothetical protein